MGKKNKKTKKKPTVTEEFDREEAKDELLALSAIFGDALTVKDDEQSFVVHVVPHPGEAETNYVSVNLEVRCVRKPFKIINTWLYAVRRLAPPLLPTPSSSLLPASGTLVATLTNTYCSA